MSWLSAIVAFFQLIILIGGRWLEADTEKKAKKAAVIKEVQDAIAKRDASALNLALSKRVR